jgi:hypothetical protein
MPQGLHGVVDLERALIGVTHPLGSEAERGA